MPFYPIKHYSVAAQVRCTVPWVKSHFDNIICLLSLASHVSINVISLSIDDFLTTPLFLVIAL